MLTTSIHTKIKDIADFMDSHEVPPEMGMPFIQGLDRLATKMDEHFPTGHWDIWWTNSWQALLGVRLTIPPYAFVMYFHHPNPTFNANICRIGTIKPLEVIQDVNILDDTDLIGWVNTIKGLCPR